MKPGQTVIEAISDNAGIGLAMVCAQKGYPLVVTMAEGFSIERRRTFENDRSAIQEQTGLKTIPQIYIGGHHVGGATELFDAAKDGSMAKMLTKNNVSWSETENRDPYTFLPGWLHAR